MSGRIIFTTSQIIMRQIHWTYHVYMDSYWGSTSKRFNKFVQGRDALPSYQVIETEEKSQPDWVDYRIQELEEKSTNSHYSRLDTELADCYYYSQSRRLLRSTDPITFTECPFEKRNLEADITSSICFSCEARPCKYMG